MKFLNIKPGSIPDQVHLPTSKSYANRALILAALKNEVVTLDDVPQALDVIFLIDAFKEVGLDVETDESTVRLKNFFPFCEKPQGAQIQVGEGGTTARFLACMLLLGSAPYRLVLGDGLSRRPWEEFVELANQLGAKVHLSGHDLFLQGPISNPTTLNIDCRRTTQFASGFLLALAFTSTRIIPENLESSSSYWAMTEKVIGHLKEFNYFKIPLDWSSATYPMAFGALRQNVFFPQLRRDPFQADSKFFDLLAQLNVAREHDQGIQINPQEIHHSLSMDVSDCLDLVPTLAFYLSHIDGWHDLRGVQNLVFKESNRLREIMRLLDTLGIKNRTDNQSLQIKGDHKLKLSYTDLQMPPDHRMVMAAALFLRLHQGGKLSNSDAISKSYPGFFDLFAV